MIGSEKNRDQLVVFNSEKAGGCNYRNKQQDLNSSQKMGVVLT